MTGLPAKLVVVVGVLEPGGVLEDLPDASDKLVEELSPLGVVEQRAADGRNLRKRERDFLYFLLSTVLRTPMH